MQQEATAGIPQAALISYTLLSTVQPPVTVNAVHALVALRD
jgi:hypothetical protein